MKVGTIFLKKDLLKEYNIPFEGFSFIDDGTNKIKQAEKVIINISKQYNIEMVDIEHTCSFYEIEDNDYNPQR